MVARLWGAGMKTRTMTEAKNDICSIIREAEKDEIVITRHGKPAAVVIGFRDEDEWFEYRLQRDEKSCEESPKPGTKSARAGS